MTCPEFDTKTAKALEIHSQREWDLARACLEKVIRLRERG